MTDDTSCPECGSEDVLVVRSATDTDPDGRTTAMTLYECRVCEAVWDVAGR